MNMQPRDDTVKQVPIQTPTTPIRAAAPRPEQWFPPPAAVPQPVPRSSAGLMLLGLALLTTLALAALLVMVLALFYRSSLILPGVRVANIDLGGLSTAEAAVLLQQRWQGPVLNLVDSSGRLHPVSPNRLGISLNVPATVDLAHQQGRSISTLARAFEAGGRVELMPVWQIDIPAAAANLQELAPQFELAPVNAGLRVVDGRAEATPALPGRAVDVAATVTRLQQQAPDVILSGRLDLVTRPVPPALTETAAAVSRANQLLDRPPSLRAYDPIEDEVFVWTISREDWATALSFWLEPGRPDELAWSVDEARVRVLLEAQAASLGESRFVQLDEAVKGLAQVDWDRPAEARLRVYHHGQQHTVQPGETFSSIGYDYGIPYPWIQQANPDVPEALSPGQVINIPSPDALLPLPVIENKRIVVSLSEQKMWAYEDGAVKWEWLASTGIPSSPTAPGIFQVQTHELNAYAASWNLWMPHFMGIYRPVPTSDFMNGFHGFPSRNGNQLLWTNDLGRRVTYGCILISSDNAALLYDWAEAGVVVEITR